jgi:hypothetical protein
MPQVTTIQCPHELRPGIKVCYHCAHNARVAAGKRRMVLLKRVGGVVIAVAGLAALGRPGLQLLRKGDATGAAPASAVAPAPSNTTSTQSTGALSSHGESVADNSPPANASIKSAEAAPAPETLHLSPTIPEGSVELAGGFSATRTGDTVVVSFDTPMLRTRRPDKFEDILRSSLSEVYGAAVQSVLSGIPRGSLVEVDDLFAELPASGMRIALSAGSAIALWPQTRDREDGPLVVAYLATITR